MVVKIGIDQWVIAQTENDTVLLTDGLSGCVALVLESDKLFCLAHVSSECNATNWHNYKIQLRTLLTKMSEK